MISDNSELHEYRGCCPVHGKQFILSRERLDRVPCLLCDRECEPVAEEPEEPQGRETD